MPEQPAARCQHCGWEAYGPFSSGGYDTADYYRIGRVSSDESLCDVVGKERADFLVRALNALAEIAVEVKLADDLPVEAQLAALWQVVRHHSRIAGEALDA